MLFSVATELDDKGFNVDDLVRRYQIVKNKVEVN